MLLHLWAVTILMWSIGVHSKSDLQVIFQNADSFKGLNLNQQKCAVTTVYSAAWASDCKYKACFCNGPQFIADNTDKCLIQQGKYYDGMYSTDTYNGIMAFYGTECGFQAQFKAVMTQSVTYTKAYAAATSTPGAAKTNVSSPLVTGGGFPGSTPGNNDDTPPSSSGNSGGSGRSGLSVEAIVGIVAGVATVIGTIVAIYMCCCR